MATLHLGHHFFGAGNLGDDFMLAGFLGALAAAGKRAEITCCAPYPRTALARRWPGVDWRPYDAASRRSCIERCDTWLGLGGSPWQSAVSPWFAEHLAGESDLCAEFGRPMFFLGVGGQDATAYAVPALRAAALRAEMIWTRDAATAEALAGVAGARRVRAGADLAHAFFAAQPLPPAVPGRLTATLNFDYAGWPGLSRALAALGVLPVRERVWFAQETRPLPGAEQWLHAQLAPDEQARWRLQLAENPGDSLTDALARWPSGEWLLTSRFHSVLAGAWAGSRAVAIATNEKLRGVAAECGYPLLELDGSPAGLAETLQHAPPPAREALNARAALARQACNEFFAMIGL